MRHTIFGCLLLVATLAAGVSAVCASNHDGKWSVVVVTEKGACDRAYRYNVRVAHDQVLYDGDSGFSVDGTVAENGTVKVSIGRGSQRANGTGKLSATYGAGTWRGHASSGECAGRWEAERR